MRIVIHSQGAWYPYHSYLFFPYNRGWLSALSSLHYFFPLIPPHSLLFFLLFFLLSIHSLFPAASSKLSHWSALLLPRLTSSSREKEGGRAKPRQAGAVVSHFPLLSRPVWRTREQEGGERQRKRAPSHFHALSRPVWRARECEG